MTFLGVNFDFDSGSDLSLAHCVNFYEGVDPDLNLGQSENLCDYLTISEYNSKFHGQNSSLNFDVFNLNIRSFQANQSILESFLGSLNNLP